MNKLLTPTRMALHVTLTKVSTHGMITGMPRNDELYHSLLSLQKKYQDNESIFTSLYCRSYEILSETARGQTTFIFQFQTEPISSYHFCASRPMFIV